MYDTIVLFYLRFLFLYFQAAGWGRLEKVEMLLKRGANRDLKSTEGKTAMDFGEI